ncbi:hypothetical protein CEP52_016474 [Fusarium oligoseptatum]|uniref:Uncharacterized protein n=1 Tax=Fusarium oligoseptatum TaxID=2604345 RepID=A0A428S3B4_9HYPO|nr:hypothetical protein CEP52_016474 [Fusarium oligoseptatum]
MLERVMPGIEYQRMWYDGALGSFEQLPALGILSTANQYSKLPHRSSSSVIPTSTIIKNTFPTHHSIISQC